MWSYGNVNVNGAMVETAWDVHDGEVKRIDLPANTGMDAKIIIDGVTYIIRDMSREAHPDRTTYPLITQAAMDAIIAEQEWAKAKAKADFEGKPWPPVDEAAAANPPKKKVADAEPSAG